MKAIHTEHAETKSSTMMLLGPHLGCLLLSNVFLLFKHPRVTLATRLPFCHNGELLLSLGSEHGSPAVASVTSDTKSASPQPVWDWSFTMRTVRLGWRRGAMWAYRAAKDLSPAILSPVFITKACFYPRCTAERLLARSLLRRSAKCLLSCRSAAASQPNLWDQEPCKTQPELS